MIKETLAGMDLLPFTEAALLIFFAVFAAVAIRTLRTDRRLIDRQAAVVLDDDETGGTR